MTRRCRIWRAAPASLSNGKISPVARRSSHRTCCAASSPRSGCHARRAAIWWPAAGNSTRNTNLQALPPLVTATAGGRRGSMSERANRTGATVELEAGGERDISVLPVRGRLRVPAIGETGYHRLLIDDRDIVLAVAPSRCHTIDDAVPDARLWGLAAQVYSLRHAGDGGHRRRRRYRRVGRSGRHGVAPMRWRSVRCMRCSPRIPRGSARTRHPPGCSSTRCMQRRGWCSASSMSPRRWRRPAWAMPSRALEALKLIDWPAAAAAKLALLRALFDRLHGRAEADGALAADFARFRADGGDLLAQHAVFEALHAEQSAAEQVIGDTGRSICAIRRVPRSRYSPPRVATKCCSMYSCNGWPIARSRRRSSAPGRPECASV